MIKNPAAGGSPDAFSIFLSGKEWVGNLFRDGKGTVDIIAGGQAHPEYVPAPAPFRLGDPPSDPDSATDREGTVLLPGFFKKRFSWQALYVGTHPRDFPEDRWTAEAAIRMIAAEDPDILYALLAECDTAQHVFGAADRPEEWIDPGTPDILWDDSNLFNQRANRDPILDIVHEADQSFGSILDVLRARGRFEDSLVILLADHSVATLLNKPLSIGQILLQAGLGAGEIEGVISAGELGFLHLSDPSKERMIEDLLESHEEFHPVLGTPVKPFIVVNREEMDSGIDNVEGLMAEDEIAGNKRGELYSGWTIDFPVSDNSKIRWPELMIFNRQRFQNVPTSSDNLGGAIPVTPLIGRHGSSQTAEIPLAIRGPGILPGVYSEEVTLADIVPTLYQLLGFTPPAHIDGKVLHRILAP